MSDDMVYVTVVTVDAITLRVDVVGEGVSEWLAVVAQRMSDELCADWAACAEAMVFGSTQSPSVHPSVS